MHLYVQIHKVSCTFLPPNSAHTQVKEKYWPHIQNFCNDNFTNERSSLYCAFFFNLLLNFSVFFAIFFFKIKFQVTLLSERRRH